MCNPHKNKILAVPVEPGLSIWTFKDRLSRLTNIPVNDQMLLFADGQVPDVRKSVLDQCWKEPVLNIFYEYLSSAVYLKYAVSILVVLHLFRR